VQDETIPIETKQGKNVGFNCVCGYRQQRRFGLSVSHPVILVARLEALGKY
jgi:hypothetical protein